MTTQNQFNRIDSHIAAYYPDIYSRMKRLAGDNWNRIIAAIHYSAEDYIDWTAHQWNDNLRNHLATIELKAYPINNRLVEGVDSTWGSL